MNSTKSVEYLKIGEDMLNRLCRAYDNAGIKGISKLHRELKDRVNCIQDRWIEIEGEDCLLYRKEGWKYYLLVQDTRKMKRLYWPYHKNFTFTNICNIERWSPGCYQEAQSNQGVLFSGFDDKIMGMPAIPLYRKLAQDLFSDKDCPMLDGAKNIRMENGTNAGFLLTNDDGFCFYDPARNAKDVTDCKFGAKISVCWLDEKFSLFDLGEQKGIIPDCLEDDDKKLLKEFTCLFKDGVAAENKNSLKDYIRNNNIGRLFSFSFDFDAIRENVLKQEIDMRGDSEYGTFLKTYLDEYDYRRARIQKYNSRWYLSDEGKGHWELWNWKTKGDEAEKGDTEKEYMVHIKGGMIARNPLADIRHNAVVGIDFGTKSTIVAVLDDNDDIIPMRVGIADYMAKPEREHYENPTVMQFIDLEKFLGDYNAKAGRPCTSWDDLKISHEALKNMIGSSKSSEYAGFATDLKQWAGGKYENHGNGRMIIRDRKNYRYELNDYGSLTDEDLDPIEVYAYYLGTFINNMHTGIYLDYLMSFPETFSLEVRNHLLSSFEKGIRRSIPQVVFEDDEARAAFRVRQGPSEPAAYAACALEQYDIDPISPDNKGVFYGVFDFGGGTTDFDFGVWKNGPEDDEEYDYVISHFGSGGDRRLGGENLLELLAYNVFIDNETQPEDGGKTNLELMREKRIVFYRPPEGKVIPGTEALTGSDERAVLNTRQLMEVLRPLWEEEDDEEDFTQLLETLDGVEGSLRRLFDPLWFAQIENPATREASPRSDVFQEKQKSKVRKDEKIKGKNSGSLVFRKDSAAVARVFLFDESGEDKIEAELQVNMDMVNRTLNDRIEQGVRNFFEAFKSAYDEREFGSTGPIHIFLAGNSSRSKRVFRLFEKYMKEYGKEFLLFPPLGTKKAIEIQKQRGIQNNEDNLMTPTGKTGVAFGLVMCRENSGIKVEPEKKKTEQIKFNYYIGISSHRKFKMIFDRDMEYRKWYKFRKVSGETETFEFYYTDLAEVASGDKEIKGNPSIFRRKCLLDKTGDGAFIFFRFLDPSQLEYVAAEEKGVEEGNYISSIYKISL